MTLELLHVIIDYTLPRTSIPNHAGNIKAMMVQRRSRGLIVVMDTHETQETGHKILVHAIVFVFV